MEAESIDKQLKKIDYFSNTDIGSILLTLINRQRFKYTMTDMFEYISRLLCLRKLRQLRHEPSYKRHFIYEKCEHHMNHELDIVSILKTQRQARLLAQVTLS